MGPDLVDMHSGEEDEKQSGGKRCLPLRRNRFRAGRKEAMAVNGSSAASRHDGGSMSPPTVSHSIQSVPVPR